jgi:hypothetical protein
MVDALDLCSLFLLPAALAAAVEWLLSSVHSDVHFKERQHDALVQVKQHPQWECPEVFAMTIHVK